MLRGESDINTSSKNSARCINKNNSFCQLRYYNRRNSSRLRDFHDFQIVKKWGAPREKRSVFKVFSKIYTTFSPFPMFGREKTRTRKKGEKMINFLFVFGTGSQPVRPPLPNFEKNRHTPGSHRTLYPGRLFREGRTTPAKYRPCTGKRKASAQGRGGARSRSKRSRHKENRPYLGRFVVSRRQEYGTHCLLGFRALVRGSRSLKSIPCESSRADRTQQTKYLSARRTSYRCEALHYVPLRSARSKAFPPRRGVFPIRASSYFILQIKPPRSRGSLFCCVLLSLPLYCRGARQAG